jgi:hypothetical protein
MLNFCIIFIPLTTFTIFFLVTASFCAPRAVNAACGVLAIIYVIFAVALNLLIPVAFFDAEVYLPFLKLYRACGLIVLKWLGIKEEPMTFLPIVTVCLSFIQFLVAAYARITFYKRFPKKIEDAIDCATNRLSFANNINFFLSLKDASFGTKLCSIFMVFDDEIMNVKNLTPAQFIALFDQRMELRFSVEDYSNDYKYFFKREKPEYYIDFYNMQHWTDEEIKKWIDIEETYKRMEHAYRRSITRKAEEEKRKAERQKRKAEEKRKAEQEKKTKEEEEEEKKTKEAINNKEKLE